MMAYKKIYSEFSYSQTTNDTDTRKHSFDVKRVIEYYTLVNLFKTMLIESANASFVFWNSFIFSSEQSNVYKSGITIFNKNMALEFLYNKIRGIYNRDEEISMKYSEYIRLVRGDDRL